MFCDFAITLTSKFIVAGEHAVLRGNDALALPLQSRTLQFNYQTNAKPYQVTFNGEKNIKLQQSFDELISMALQAAHQPQLKISGNFAISSNIPVGSGLGSSAAISLALGSWFLQQQLISQSQLFDFARRLENLFHGESTGLDIAVAMHNKPILFNIHKPIVAITPQWQPNWYLSYSGEAANTAMCIHQVKNLWQHHAQQAKLIDEKMQAAVQQAKSALEKSATPGQVELINAIKQAQSCFEDWQLQTELCKNHIESLYQAGAQAVKLTGSGLGGYVLSLWQPNVTPKLPFPLIPTHGTK